LRAAAKRAARSQEEYEAHLKERRNYEAKNRDHINENRQLRYGADVERLLERPFIGWDGEGYTDYHEELDLVWANDREREAIQKENPPVGRAHHYMLLGCSVFPGKPLVGIDLRTETILDYILYVESQFPDAFHVGFSFAYDVNMILRDLPTRTLRHLADYNVCHWRGYTIRYIPGKWFRISRGRAPNHVTVTIYDVFSFFNSSYVTSLIKFGVATRAILDRVIEGKDKRGFFSLVDIAYVRQYWQDEISYMPLLMDRVREACYDAGLYITQWYGCGALAAYILRKRGVRQWKSKDIPPEAQIGIQTAFAGGRFQPWQCGLSANRIYTADINSAYIYACSLLPRLDNGRWLRMLPDCIDRGNIARFGVYHISYDVRKAPDKRQDHPNGRFPSIYPLFHRDNHNRVSFPGKVEGWYWSPEAKLVADDPRAEFLEAWIYDDDGSFPFQWVSIEFDKRLALQHDGNPAEKTFKWALAAMYGAFARRVGWDKKNRKPPGSHELSWAGFITSWCRAEMYRVALECWRQRGLISIDTDGVTSTVPFDVAWLDRGVGENLGQWKLEEHAGMLYWQTGFYWLLDDDGNWSTAKTRGMPRGTVDASVGLSALNASYYRSKDDKKHAEFTRRRTSFIGYKAALNRGDMKLAFRWETNDQTVKMGGGNAYRHMVCKKCLNPELDMMHTLFQVPPITYINTPHRLPWLEEQPGMHPNILEMEDIEDIVMDGDEVDKL
jgi:hypothetical protein